MFQRKHLILAGFLVLVLLVVSGAPALGQDVGGGGGGQAGRYVRPPQGTQGSYKFVASKHSKEYHWPACKLAQRIKPEDRLTFKSAQEAQAAGYVHCKVCSRFRF
jgi:hypothetical protein